VKNVKKTKKCWNNLSKNIKYNEVLEKNKKLTESNKNNLKVIMELKKRIIEYREFIDEIARHMSELDKQNLQNINSLRNIDHVQQLMSNKSENFGGQSGGTQKN